MAQPSPFQVELEDFGDVDLPNVKRWSITSSYSGNYDSFQLTFVSRDGERVGDPRLADALLWQRCRIRINERPYLIGRFEWSEVGTDSEITLGGLDYRYELAAAQVDPEVKVKEGMTLSSVIKQAVGCCGVAHVRGDAAVRLRDIRTGKTLTTPAPATFLVQPLKEYAPRDEEHILPYLQRIAARHGVTVQPGASRDELVLSKPNYSQTAAWNFIRYRETGNSLTNVLTSRCRRDMGAVPTYIQYDGQSQAASDTPNDVAARGRFKSTGSATATTGALVETVEVEWPSPEIPGERAVSKRIRPSDGVKLDEGVYRPFFRRDTDSKDLPQLRSSMLRGWADRMKSMLCWEGTVQGHRQDGAPFSVDTMAQVYDEVCAVEQLLWVESVQLQGDSSSGTTAQITARLPGTYPF